MGVHDRIKSREKRLTLFEKVDRLAATTCGLVEVPHPLGNEGVRATGTAEV